MTKVEHGVLGVLTYYDIFSYPLLPAEIHYHLETAISTEEILESLEQLTAAGLVYRFGDYYTLQNNVSLIKRREQGNRIAAILLPRAKRISKILNLFPFVRGIGISGSLSKNFADENSDFDYFIITKVNRMWIASTLLGLFKKLSYFAGKQHYFCLNYYIDESCLEIPEKNIFTATELFTLKAGSGPETLRSFFEANKWAREFYGNYNVERPAYQLSSLGSKFKNLAELLLDKAAGNRLDNWLMKTSVNRWKKKKEAGRLIDLNGKPINLYLTDKHFCKHDPKYFQAQVLALYSAKMKNIQEILPAFQHQLKA
ncbi:hypothetical protein GZH53_05280 [Flavihumibacter sp. R14]|nr:hypothetical protein [Flavihumibacter soli]